MLSHRVVFIFLTAVMTVSVRTDNKDDALKREGCGPYGFTCMNEKTLEFCPIIVDGKADKTEMFDCEDDYYCDEENPAYCTPIEAWLKSREKDDSRKRLAEVPKKVDKDVSFDEYGDYKEVRLGRAADADNCDNCETTTIAVGPADTTIVSEQFDEDKEFATAQPIGNPPFNCQSYGFFPDNKNSTLFWYCDVPSSGNGFQLRHMICGQDRYFDELMHNCVLKGLLRKDRREGCNNSSNTKNTKKPVNCLEKKPGRYSDESNCHIYHLCLPEVFAPAVQLTFKCPNDTAYDPASSSCTANAMSRCQASGNVSENTTNNKIDCKSPTRFRSTEDCSSYFLCFVDNVIEIKCPKFYKFDDQSLECLPEKVAGCQEYGL